MGRETACEARYGDLHGRVVAHLDGQALQLRGAIRATLPLASLQQVRADGDGLHAVTPAGPLRLAMGIRDAAAWRERILAPPSLAKKLGLVADLPVHVLGGHAEPRGVLAAAGARETPAAQASMSFAVVDSPDDLARLAACCAQLPLPLWVLRRKGREAPVKEGELMAALRQRGLAPGKTAAWSDAYSADRYGKARR